VNKREIEIERIREKATEEGVKERETTTKRDQNVLCPKHPTQRTAIDTPRTPATPLSYQPPAAGNQIDNSAVSPLLFPASKNLLKNSGQPHVYWTRQ